MGLDMWLDKRNKDGTRKNIIDWRKANQIHGYFAEVLGYTENCNSFEVTKEQLQELLNVINKVLNSEEMAQELLPTCAGFFFGSYEYNEYYFNELVITSKKLTQELKNAKDDDIYYYTASW